MLFILFMTLPVGGLIVLGSSAPYGQRPFKALPESWAGFFNQDHENIVEGLLERSPVRRDTIKLHSMLTYYGLGYVDTSHMISGRDGWLFYKQ
jgi:hypothetical protein